MFGRYLRCGTPCLCSSLRYPMHVQIAEVVDVMDKWGFSYVENLTWVHMAPNNTVVASPSLYARRSHLSLFIFRKAGCPSSPIHIVNIVFARCKG